MFMAAPVTRSRLQPTPKQLEGGRTDASHLAKVIEHGSPSGLIAVLDDELGRSRSDPIYRAELLESDRPQVEAAVASRDAIRIRHRDQASDLVGSLLCAVSEGHLACALGH